MLTLFKRHKKSCPHTARKYRRCSCPIHVEGSLGGEKIRRAMDQTSWEAAENEVREWIKSGKVGGSLVKLIPVEDAVDLYLTDVAARVRASTVRLHRVLLKDSLVSWAKSQGFRYMKQLDVKAMIEYRASWKYAPLTALKKFERLRSFFRFCVAAGWLAANPMEALKAPKADSTPTMPFSNEEIEAVFKAARAFNIRGSYGRSNPVRVIAFLYVLRYSGLRISDAAGLAKDRLQDGKLFLHVQHKTRVPVFVPLPPFVVQALEAQAKQSVHPAYFFWTGVGTIESACASWKRTLYRIFEIAGIEGGHAHRFRDTFSVNLLLNDVPLETVSQLLGHRSTKVTEQSYAPWIKARQDRLEEAVRRSWPEQKAKLKLVTG
jgi:integrase/recombinase XerD